MIAMKTEMFTACDHALSAAANGLYQGVILTVVVALTLRCLGRSTNAATRHSIWMVTLFLLPTIMVAHLWLDHRPVLQPAQSGTVASEPEVGGGSPSFSLIIPAAQEDLLAQSGSAPQIASGTEKEANFILTDLPKTQVATGPPVPWADHAEPAVLILPKDRGDSVAIEHKSLPPSIWIKAFTLLSTSVRDGFQWALERLTKPLYWDLGSGFSPRRIVVLAVLGAWLSVFLSKTILLAWRLYELRKLKQNSLPADEELTWLFDNLCFRLGIKRQVSLRVSDVYRSPVVLGFLQPVVLLPPPELLPGDSVATDHILRHELAHVQRKDDWANLIQHFVQASFFFHPGVWWICRQLALDREIACDDQVLQQVCQPRAYALVLANLASRMKRCPPMLAPGASTNKSQLQQRINMILDTKRNTSPRLAKARLGFVTSAAALLAGLAIYSGPRLVLAETPTPETAENAPQPEVSVDVAPSVAVSVSTAVSANNAITVAQADDSIDPVPAADAGPRYKPEPAPALPAPSAVNVAPPATPAPPMIVAVPGPAPAIITAPRSVALPPGAPGFPMAASGHGGDDGSIERRVERLERMVKSLMAQQDGQHPKPKGPEWNWNWNMDEKQKADMKAMAEREAARAERESKRAEEEVKRAHKEMERAAKEQGDRARGMQKESSQRQLEALRRARENLEHQMQKLDSQIEKLEQDQEKLQEEQERRSELEQEQKEKQEAAVAEVETQ
jgi:beta-lactamase regulating signal transducer with metallopeptidase domain